MEKEKKPKRGYWYEYHYEWCVICGRENKHKYRVYDRPKPENPEDRHHERDYVCWNHF